MARERVSASRVSEEEKAREELLSEVARERREVVSWAWVWEEDSRRGAVVAGRGDDEDDDGAGGWAVEGGCRRLRRVDTGEGGDAVGGLVSWRRSSDEEEEWSSSSESFC